MINLFQWSLSMINLFQWRKYPKMYVFLLFTRSLPLSVCFTPFLYPSLMPRATGVACSVLPADVAARVASSGSLGFQYVSVELNF